MLSWERIVKLGDIKIAIIIEPEVRLMVVTIIIYNNKLLMLCSIM